MKIKYLFALTSFLMILISQHAMAATNILHTWPDNKAVSLEPKGVIQVVNIWATWCGPCRKEMPMLSHWYLEKQREGKNAPEVIGIALDNDANLQRYTQQVKVHYPLLRYTGQDSRGWMQSLGNKIGGLPFTLVRAPKCDFTQTILGGLTEAKLNAALSSARKQCQHKGIK